MPDFTRNRSRGKISLSRSLISFFPCGGFFFFSSEMLRERIHPMIGKLSELLVSVNRSNPFSDSMTTGPRTHLDFKIFPKISPTNNANRFHGHNIDGVGLGIVAALDNSSTRTSVRRFEEHPVNRPGSDPVPITVNSRRCNDDDDDDYTYVTCHHGADGSCTRVYRDGFECSARKNPDEPPEGSPEFEGLDFLNACFLCRKELHGLDIYIYRGERAFCSEECRSVHITNEERKERCRSEFPSSPYTAGVLVI